MPSHLYGQARLNHRIRYVSIWSFVEAHVTCSTRGFLWNKGTPNKVTMVNILREHLGNKPNFWGHRMWQFGKHFWDQSRSACTSMQSDQWLHCVDLCQVPQSRASDQDCAITGILYARVMLHMHYKFTSIMEEHYK